MHRELQHFRAPRHAKTDFSSSRADQGRPKRVVAIAFLQFLRRKHAAGAQELGYCTPGLFRHAWKPSCSGIFTVANLHSGRGILLFLPSTAGKAACACRQPKPTTLLRMVETCRITAVLWIPPKNPIPDGNTDNRGSAFSQGIHRCSWRPRQLKL